MKIVIKKGVKTLIIPLLTVGILSTISSINGVSLINTSGHWLTLLRSTIVIAFTSWALSLNLHSGRFDFSLGSIAVLSAMISAKIAQNLGLSRLPLFLVAILAGIILGLISGLLYVTLKLPPIITSLGVTLLYEAFTFIVSGGEGVLISTQLELLKISSLKWLISFGIIGFACMYVAMNYTVFGYEHKALRNGQLIGTQIGINEKRNAVLSYTISGALMSVVGLINLTTRGSASVALNFSSISTMFIAFLPLFIGGYIGRFSEEILGIFLGSLTSAFITLSFVRLDVSSQMQSLINAVILLLFLIYLNNEDVFRRGMKTKNEKI